MITWKEAQDKVGIKPKIPEAIYNYYAYKSGTCITCETREIAQSYSKQIERFCVNQDEIDKAIELTKNHEIQAVKIWMDALKEEYEELVRYGIFDIVYSKAYEEQHAYGYDAIANKMINLELFVLDIINAHQKKLYGEILY